MGMWLTVAQAESDTFSHSRNKHYGQRASTSSTAEDVMQQPHYFATDFPALTAGRFEQQERTVGKMGASEMERYHLSNDNYKQYETRPMPPKAVTADPQDVTMEQKKKSKRKRGTHHEKDFRSSTGIQLQRRRQLQSPTMMQAQTPANNNCDTATRIPDFTAAGRIYLDGTTNGATAERPHNNTKGDTIPFRCYHIAANAPAVWYRLAGHGGIVKLSTCGPSTSFDTKIIVMTDGVRLDRGGCSALDMRCIASNDDASCGLGSEVTFPALDGYDYLVLVTGHGLDETGDFELSVERGATGDLFDYYCENPTAVFDIPSHEHNEKGVMGAKYLYCGCVDVPGSHYVSCYRFSENVECDGTFSTCTCDGPNCAETREIFEFEDPDNSNGQLLYWVLLEECFSSQTCTGHRNVGFRAVLNTFGLITSCDVLAVVPPEQTIYTICTQCQSCEDGSKQGILYNCFDDITSDGECDTSRGNQLTTNPFLGDTSAVQQVEEGTEPSSSPSMSLTPTTAFPTVLATLGPTVSESISLPTSSPTVAQRTDAGNNGSSGPTGLGIGLGAFVGFIVALGLTALVYLCPILMKQRNSGTLLEKSRSSDNEEGDGVADDRADDVETNGNGDNNASSETTGRRETASRTRRATPASATAAS